MNMIGICGDNCTYCPRYIATKNGSAQELEKVKDLWVRLELRNADVPVKDMSCSGCMPKNKCAYKEIRACVNQKDCENCGLCDEYPCELITIAFDKSEKLKSKAGMVCNQKEMDLLEKAFFSKREYFNHIHQKYPKS